MEPKQVDIPRHASALSSREGYQSPSIERIAEHAGISKVAFYRYYTDREALILATLKQEESESMQDLTRIMADKATARGKLFAVPGYYHRWFICDTFHSYMFTHTLFGYDTSSSAIREQCSRFKSLLWQFLCGIPLQVLRPEPAERIVMMMVILIGGVIATQQAESAECREIPPGATA